MSVQVTEFRQRLLEASGVAFKGSFYYRFLLKWFRVWGLGFRVIF